MSADKPKQVTNADHEIGTRIALRRKAKGLSQTALGTAVGVTFQQVQKYEKGANRVGAGRLQKIADLLNVPVAIFFGDEVGATPPFDSSVSLLQAPDALELLHAYRSIANEEARRDVLALVRTAARLSKAAASA